MKEMEKEDWEAEHDARTLIQYQELMKDKKRMENAKKELQDKMKEIKGAMECCD